MGSLAEQVVWAHCNIEHNAHERKDREHQPSEPGALLAERIPEDEQGTGDQ